MRTSSGPAAELSSEDKDRLRAINAELASLQTTFSQNVLSEVNDSAVVVESRDELGGLSDNEISSAAEAAAGGELEGQYVLALRNTSGQPLLASLENRPLRQRVMETSLARGSRGGEFDNREIITTIARLRAERAALLGYATHAAYALERQTAQTVEAVNQRLSSLTPPAVANARREAGELQAIVRSEGGAFELAAWDWGLLTSRSCAPSGLPSTPRRCGLISSSTRSYRTASSTRHIASTG